MIGVDALKAELVVGIVGAFEFYMLVARTG